MLTAKQVAEQLAAMGYLVLEVTEGSAKCDGDVMITERVWVQVGNRQSYFGVTADIGNDEFWTPPLTSRFEALRRLIDEALKMTMPDPSRA